MFSFAKILCEISSDELVIDLRTQVGGLCSTKMCPCQPEQTERVALLSCVWITCMNPYFVTLCLLY